MSDAITLDAVSKVHGKGRGAVAALREVTVRLPKGGFTAVMGPSGSGKSTFLHCAAGLDRPTAGTVRLGGTDLSRLGERELTELRRDRAGFVFQSFNLVSALTVEQNVTLPLRLAGRRADPGRLAELVRRVGLQDRTGHRPGQLSGGQQQRVAIARALVADPEVVFADEPTGALDTMTAREVLVLLRQTVDELGQTLVMVTHDPVAASYADEVLFLADGRVVDTLTGPTAAAVADRMIRLGAWNR
ncbi:MULTISPECIES: ABC transporter ATP-binding protein [Kitasatospora]|uniref:ABC transporter ATP-binding protein n=1 Tax=Kitasatospora TaxID=2063 RepID=UPI0004C3CEA1|nr:MULTISPECIES: ABC transporter ATP-binding protein [unclassified Kitasatospora]WAL72696.1 ABC transporter ATP-binding protein [Kitasatospora sp. YST-16]WNW38744.1 ABC transporter ATP-binding protein [Streptomyces sp. Li-HN-5-13]